MLPDFETNGLLPEGVHQASWGEMVARFGYNAQRTWLLGGLQRALSALRAAGCQSVYLDGSFVTSKLVPGDYDLCWGVAGVDPARLDPVLLDFKNGRKAMKAKYLGDLFPDRAIEGRSRRPFIEFFQIDKTTGNRKGIVTIDLRSSP